MARTGNGASKPLKLFRSPEPAVFTPLVLPLANISASGRITADPRMLRFHSTELDLGMLVGCGGWEEVCKEVVK
jgi:hypothetical protein